jgi:invasion protein IalB
VKRLILNRKDRLRRVACSWSLPLIGLLIVVHVAAAQAEERFEAWTISCSAEASDVCRAVSEAPAAGAQAMRLAVVRDPARSAAPRLVVTLIAPLSAPPRPRIALAVDGGPPVRLASGADLSSGPGAQPGEVELRLSEAATKRLLPFLRRGKAMQLSVSGEGGEQIAAGLPLPGFAAAAAELDDRQGRTGRDDALAALIGGGTPAALAGRLRDVGRDQVPASLRTIMEERDCPVWDGAEGDPSFLADQSFAADLGGGRTLWAIVCASGSYNADFALFVEDPSKAADRFEPLLFAAFVEAIGWTGVETLANVAYDPETRELKAFDKGRGAGDCGQVGLWEWVGAAFRMIEYRAKEECDGVGEADSFPIVFRGER